MDIVGLVVNAVAGAIGGGASGAALKEKGLGTAVNMVVGLVGGTAGGALMQKLGFFVTAAESSGFDIATLAGQAVGGGVAGAILTAVVGLIKASAKKAA
jgi:uncharacterized membrane protein YeaQ/YmgE (transglycosylase-associated protein family)